MEFLKHFAKAKEMGISKEDFMSVWKSNMAIERQNAEAKLLELGGNIDEALHKKCAKETMKQPYGNEQEEINKLRSEFHQMFEVFRAEMLSMHEQLKKQIEEECRLNLDSMKVYVQNEIELLYQNKQDLYSKDCVLQDSKSNIVMKEQHHETAFNIDLPLQHLNISQELKSMPLGDILQKSSLPGTDYEQDIGWESLTQSKSENYLPVVSRSYAAAAASDFQNKEEMERMLKPGLVNSHNESEVQKCGSAYNTVEAKGFIAQIISKQMAQRGTSPSGQSSRSRSRAKIKEVIPYQGALLGKFPIAKHSAILPIFENGVEFSVSNCSRWESSKADYYTPYYYTLPKRCKVRLQMRFSAKGFLCVNVLLSKGADDENIKWPVKLSGCGEIYNHGSKRFTPIWSIDPQNCSKPGGTLEYSIGATVCLITSRGTHNDVTFSKLTEKKYLFQDSFTFKWCLKADDDFPK